MASTNKYRWGMLPGTAIKNALNSGTSDQLPSEPLLQWEDLDHSQTLVLGYSGRTNLVFTKDVLNFNPSYFALQSCHQRDLTSEKRRLAEMFRGKEHTPFLSIRCVFEHNSRIFAGSELCDISLADIIGCTIPLKEKHLATILNQVVRALHILHTDSAHGGEPLIYGCLRAANVFLRRDGTIKLATFGSKVHPQRMSAENNHRDRWDLGALASHIISGTEEEPEDLVLRQKTISMSCIGKSVDAKFEPSPELIDIWGLCFQRQSGVGNILKHPFLRRASPTALTRLVLNAERTASRECIPQVA